MRPSRKAFGNQRDKQNANKIKHETGEGTLPLQFIKTSEQVILVSGKVFYNDRRRRIDLKRPIRDLFERTTGDVTYVMELCLSQEKAVERMQQLTAQQVIPIILYFNTVERHAMP